MWYLLAPSQGELYSVLQQLDLTTIFVLAGHCVIQCSPGSTCGGNAVGLRFCSICDEFPQKCRCWVKLFWPLLGAEGQHRHWGLPAEASGHYGNMKSLASAELIYGVLTHPAPSTWKGQRCASGVWGACAWHPCEHAHCLGTCCVVPGPRGALPEELLVQGCQAHSATSLSWVGTWGHLHCPPDCSPSFGRAGLNGAMVSTRPSRQSPGLAEPAALPLCTLETPLLCSSAGVLAIGL